MKKAKNKHRTLKHSSHEGRKRNKTAEEKYHVVTPNSSSTTGTTGGSRLPPLVLLGVLVATAVPLVLLVAWDASMLSGPFHLDAGPKIAENPDIRRVGAALMERHRIGSERHASDSLRYNDPSRPLASLSFQLNYYFAGGDLDDPTPFRVVNFALHAVNAVLVGLLADLVGRATRLSSLPSAAEGGAAAAASASPPSSSSYYCSRWTRLFPSVASAALFAASPLNHDVAAYTYARSDLLGAMGALLYVVLGLGRLVTAREEEAREEMEGGRRGEDAHPPFCFSLPMAAALLFGLFSRQLTLVAPAALGFVHLVLLELPSHRGDSGGVTSGGDPIYEWSLIVRRALAAVSRTEWAHLPSLAVIAAYVAFRLCYFGAMGDLEKPIQKNADFPLGCYWKTQPYSWLRYGGTLLVPRGLAIDHAVYQKRFCKTGQAAACCLGTALLFAAMVVRTFQAAAPPVAPRPRKRCGGGAHSPPMAGRVRVGPAELVALSMLGWYGLYLLPSSAVWNSSVYVERRAYVSGAGLYIALSIGVSESSRRLLSPAGGATSCQGKSVPSRWLRHLHRLAGASIIAAFVTYFVVVSVGRNPVFYSSESMWRDVVDQYPESVRGLNNLSNALMGRLRRQLAECDARRNPAGHPCHHDESLGREIESNYSKLLVINPGDGYPMMGLGNLHKALGTWDVAMGWWEKAIEVYPRLAAAAHKAIGTVFHQQGRLEEALQHYKDAMSIDPLTMELHNNLALVYNSLGKKDLAKEVWREGLNLFPGDRLLLGNRDVINGPSGCDGAAAELPDRDVKTTLMPSKDSRVEPESRGMGGGARQEQRWDFDSAVASLLLSTTSRDPSSCDPRNDYSCSPPLNGDYIYDAYGGSPPLDGDKKYDTYGGSPPLDGDRAYDAEGRSVFSSKHEYGSSGVHGMGGSTVDFHMTSANREGLLRLQQISSDMPEDCVPGLLRGRTKDVDVKIAWTDDELRRFVDGYFTGRVVQALDGLKFPHKGDLWRYCWLFAVGGIYLDIKTVAVAPLAQTFDGLMSEGIPTWYMVWSNYSTRPHVHNGILATPAGNPFFLRLILRTVETDPLLLEDDYNVFIRQLLKEAEAEYGSITGPGEYYANGWRLVVLEERCSADPHHEECKAQTGGLDRYGLCCNIYDVGGSIRFHTRDRRYPWKECLSHEAVKAEQSRLSARASQIFDTALHHHKIGNLPAAEEGYRKVVEQGPVLTSDTYNNLALLLFNTGRFAEAQEMWHRGWNLFPRNKLLTENRHIIFKEQ